LSSITCYPYRKQKDLISTSLSILLTTINNTKIVDDNEDKYHEDDIKQIESTTTIQVLVQLILSNKLSEELLDDDLIEIINTSCRILVLESYSRNDSILGRSK
ncbi:unnamed protein product, partial [Rotaria sp. Silwood1]